MTTRHITIPQANPLAYDQMMFQVNFHENSTGETVNWLEDSHDDCQIALIAVSPSRIWALARPTDDEGNIMLDERPILTVEANPHALIRGSN